MDDSMILDGLFVLIGLLFLPIGIRRGVTREVFVTAGLLAGATLARSWAAPWGKDLADFVDSRNGAGQFAVSAAFVLGGAIVLGYAGAAAARIERPGGWARALGGLLAVLNGALISAFVLRDIKVFLTDDGTERSLEESYVARTLLNDFGWVLVGMSAAATIAILFGLLAGARRPAPAPAPSWQPPAADRGKRKRRMGWSRDDGKVEPEASGFNPTQGRYAADAPHVGETMPIAPVTGGSWSMDRAQGRPTGNEWLDVTRSAPLPAYQPVDAQPIRCLSCGERLSNEDAFCPRCGRART